MAELELDDFLRGILAVLAYRQKTRLQLAPGIVDVALAKTLEVMSKQLARERLEPTFRLTVGDGTKLHGGLDKEIRALLAEGILRKEGDLTPLAWNPHDAFAYLSATPLPLNVLERAAKVFWGQHETTRIHVNLRKLATRRHKA